MSTSRLQIYNDALIMCGERTLSSLTENREPRRVLDSIWNNGKGVIDFALEKGLWTFAARSMKYDYSPSVEPEWGYRRAFNKPTDFIRTAMVAVDEFFQQPLTRYMDEAGFWFADWDTIYVSYISNDPTYGANLGNWTQAFGLYVSGHLAARAVMKLSQDKDKQRELQVQEKKLLLEARSQDAMNMPTRFFPRGSWVNSRWGTRLPGDNGYRGGTLVG